MTVDAPLLKDLSPCATSSRRLAGEPRLARAGTLERYLAARAARAVGRRDRQAWPAARRGIHFGGMLLPRHIRIASVQHEEDRDHVLCALARVLRAELERFRVATREEALLGELLHQVCVSRDVCHVSRIQSGDDGGDSRSWMASRHTASTSLRLSDVCVM